jgi:RNA-directed DNA polymerase
MLLFMLHGLWSIIDDAGSVVSAVVSSHPALLSFHMVAGNLDRAHLQLAPETTHRRRLSRWPPSRTRRVTCLGCACAWRPERHGAPRGLRRTARPKLHAACQRLTAWIKHHRHRPERACFQRLQARLRGHDHYDGVRGTSRALTRFCRWAMDCRYKWLNRRGGKPSSSTWEQGTRLLDRVKIGRPGITEGKRRRVLA